MREKSTKKSTSKGDAKARSSKEKKEAKEKKDAKQTSLKKAHCFVCGSSEHAVKDYPHKNKGPKCFRCDQFGHIANKCENPTKSNKKEEEVNRVTIDDETITIQINETNIPAVLDTSSSKTLLRDDEYRRIGNSILKPTERIFKGFGNVRTKAIGVFDARLTIQDEVYHNEVYVVPIQTMDTKMLLGKDLHRQMDIRILGGQMTIRKIATMKSEITTQEVEIKKSSQSGQEVEIKKSS